MKGSRDNTPALILEEDNGLPQVSLQNQTFNHDGGSSGGDVGSNINQINQSQLIGRKEIDRVSTNMAFSTKGTAANGSLLFKDAN